MMGKSKEKYIVVYNSSAGKGKSYTVARKIANCLAEFGKEDIVVFSNNKIENLHNHFMFCEEKPHGTVIAVGGDGTLSTVVNAVVLNDIEMNIAVYPCGTANDFASSLKVPKSIKKFVKMIISETPINCDIIKVNDVYGINAVGSGNFSHAGEVYDPRLKKIFGKFAYYSKCVKSSLSMKSNRLKIEFSDGKCVEDDFLFYYAVNSKVAGGFRNFYKKAKIDDGKFGFIGIKKCGFIAFCFLFLKILLGIHANSKYVVFKEDTCLKVTLIGENKKFIKSDIDGNIGPNHPLEISVIKDKIKVYSKSRG